VPPVLDLISISSVYLCALCHASAVVVWRDVSSFSNWQEGSEKFVGFGVRYPQE
jgi:hypothetical protein